LNIQGRELKEHRRNTGERILRQETQSAETRGRIRGYKIHCDNKALAVFLAPLSEFFFLMYNLRYSWQ
jgi:hypothetical protein